MIQPHHQGNERPAGGGRAPGGGAAPSPLPSPARLAAVISVNRELVQLYRSIGRDVLARQATDLRAEFPEMKGFSPRNLKYMRSFAAYPDLEFVQTVSAQLTWSHNTKVLDSVRDPDARRFYLEQAIEHGWSLNVLASQIYSDPFHGRARRSPTSIGPWPRQRPRRCS